MNFIKIIAAAALSVTLSMTPVFAGSYTAMVENNVASVQAVRDIKTVKPDAKDFRHNREEFNKDPVKFLEEKKIKIQTLLKEGKITKEKADEITARLDSKIKEIQSFNKLTLQQKREKLINDCRTLIDKQVKEGKLDSAKASGIISDYTEKINKWDGTGYPFYHPERSGHRCKGPKLEK